MRKLIREYPEIFGFTFLVPIAILEGESLEEAFEFLHSEGIIVLQTILDKEDELFKKTQKKFKKDKIRGKIQCIILPIRYNKVFKS
jgi:hypothetical protein